MKPERRFLVAPSLARLIRREEKGLEKVVEGYFPSRPGRTHFVRVAAAGCRAILISASAEGADAVDDVELPRSQAEALMDVCAGSIAFERTRVLGVHGGEVFLDRVVTPGRLDLLSVAFDDPREAQGFRAPAWFGREVSREPAFERQSIALSGLPRAENAPLSDAMLDAYLDGIEGGSGEDQPRVGEHRTIVRPTGTAPGGSAASSAPSRRPTGSGPSEAAPPALEAPRVPAVDPRPSRVGAR